MEVTATTIAALALIDDEYEDTVENTMDIIPILLLLTNFMYVFVLYVHIKLYLCTK
jgi:hypothetical protein